ncbi:MAG: hypothetical protein A2X94_14950 [Bdellovibrionales bacterium GWB1_55_8]|nr:MAG: hypothetical protein A2X94_14950 [Bdellovibrionales bacterium GWB1_55_8]
MAFSSVSSTPASAGEILRLKAGEIRLETASKQFIANSAKDILSGRSNAEQYFILQFAGQISESDKAELRTQGIEPKTYLPDDALIVKASRRNAAAAALSPEISAVAPYAAEWKISPDIFDIAQDHGTFMISTFDDALTDEVLNELNLVPGVQAHRSGQRGIIAQMSLGNVGRIARIEGIEWIQTLPVFITFDLPMAAEFITPSATVPPITGYESGTKLMKMENAWKRGFSGKGQVVGMADTGVDTGIISTMHPDLSNVVKGYAMGYGSKTWEDINGHGTHVCGSVIGTGAVSNGGIRGGAYNATMVVDGLWSPIMNNLAFKTDFNIIVGKPYADGARIHTNSWGSPQNLGAYDSFASQADAYMWENPEMLMIFAAGNSGVDANKDGRIDEGSVSSPGTAKNVLTVGASENLLAEGGIQRAHGTLRGGDKNWGVEPIKSDTLSNNADGMACFSSRGPTKDGRLKPEIVAPGTNIVSVLSTKAKEKMWGEFGTDYVFAGGTSMATPLTAGAAAVVREYLVKDRGFATPSAALLKASLIHTAKDMYPGQYGTGPKQELPTRRPNVHEGYGRVDMEQATSLGNAVLVDDKAGLGLNETKGTSVFVQNGKGLRVTLVYTDAPGAASSAKALVNDLDVQIVSSSGKVYEKADRTNNTEMLEIANLPEGTYQVLVKGMNVPQGKQGKQPYALLISRY